MHGVQRRIEPGRRRSQPLLHARHGREQARRRHRLQHVVDCALVEGGDRVLVIGGDEDDMTAPASLARNFQPGRARHLDVEEHHVGAMLVEQAQRLHAVGRLADDRQFRPELAELFDKLVAQCRFVFSDDCGRVAHAAFGLRSECPIVSQIRPHAIGAEQADDPGRIYGRSNWHEAIPRPGSA